jgi:hypothetical protein
MLKRYAFIDVQNTETTTRKVLGFITDWSKLLKFLKDNWKCEKVFFYSGIDAGDSETEKEFELLIKNGGIVRSKVVFSYKNRNRNIKIKCPKCSNEFSEMIEMGYNRKSNCDVDLKERYIKGKGREARPFLRMHQVYQNQKLCQVKM